MCENEREGVGSLTLIRLAEVPELNWLPKRDGKGVSLSTVHRWAASGLKGHKLRTVRVGGTLCTTEAWLWEFFEGLSAPEGVPVPRTPKQRQRDREKARRELEEAGI